MQTKTLNILKTAVGATPPRVRISPLPPLTYGNIWRFLLLLSGMIRFVSGAYREQKAHQIIRIWYKIVCSNSADSPSVLGGAA